MLSKTGRTQVVTACGPGKTLVGCSVAACVAGADDVVGVLVPALVQYFGLLHCRSCNCRAWDRLVEARRLLDDDGPSATTRACPRSPCYSDSRLMRDILRRQSRINRRSRRPMTFAIRVV